MSQTLANWLNTPAMCKQALLRKLHADNLIFLAENGMMFLVTNFMLEMEGCFLCVRP